MCKMHVCQQGAGGLSNDILIRRDSLRDVFQYSGVWWTPLFRIPWNITPRQHIYHALLHKWYRTTLVYCADNFHNFTSCVPYVVRNMINRTAVNMSCATTRTIEKVISRQCTPYAIPLLSSLPGRSN